MATPQILENLKAGNLPTVDTQITLTEKTFSLIFTYALLTTAGIVFVIGIAKCIGKLINKN